MGPEQKWFVPAPENWPVAWVSAVGLAGPRGLQGDGMVWGCQAIRKPLGLNLSSPSSTVPVGVHLGVTKRKLKVNVRQMSFAKSWEPTLQVPPLSYTDGTRKSGLLFQAI